MGPLAGLRVLESGQGGMGRLLVAGLEVLDALQLAVLLLLGGAG